MDAGRRLELDEFRKRCLQMSKAELRQQLGEPTLQDDLVLIARDVLAEREFDEVAGLQVRSINEAKGARMAAWVSAGIMTLALIAQAIDLIFRK